MTQFPINWKHPQPMGRRELVGCVPALRMEWFIDSQIVAWKRGIPIRARKGATIVPDKANDASQAIVRNRWKRWFNENPDLKKLFPWKGPVRATFYFLVPTPARWKGKKKEKDSWPDIDNLAKQIKDSLNHKNGWFQKRYGIPGLYRDDGQIVDVYADKRYGADHLFDDLSAQTMPVSLIVFHLYKDLNK